MLDDCLSRSNGSLERLQITLEIKTKIFGQPAPSELLYGSTGRTNAELKQVFNNFSLL
jgi:hypothetical protein